MKYKFLGVIAIVTVVTIVSYNVFASQRNVELSDLTLNNIEALASSSEWGDDYCRMNSQWYCLPWGTGTACYCYM